MSQRERTILRCRRCRKGVIDSTCLSTQTGATDESSEAGCSIWHVDVDMLPEWILTSVHQAQWTVGKLYCQNCGARLGGFNFINHSECPCGRDAAVHLSKSRVDRDHKHCVLIVQPRRRTSEKEQSALLTDDCQSRERRMDFNSLHLNCAAQASSDNPPSFSFSPLYCISHRRRRSLEEDASIRSSCFCPTVRSAVQRPRTGEYTPVSYPTSQRFDSEGEASFIACRPFVSARTRSPLLQRVQDAESFPETSSVHQNVPVPALFLRGSSVSDSVAEGEEGDEEEEEEAVVVPDAFMAPLASNRLSRREKNRLKSIRRKQRRRERWLHSQQEQAESVSHSLSEGEDLDREGLTCAVCLEVYFSPYSCQPCAHVFCEPCLRTIGKNRPTNTPCPLCRALISHTTLHKELDQTAKTFFPKAYHARKQSFQSAACAKWPLPSCRKRYRAFWGEQRQAALAGRRWHFSLGGFTMDALDFGGVRGWLFDNGLVMVYISVNWILATFFSFFFMYFFFF